MFLVFMINSLGESRDVYVFDKIQLTSFFTLPQKAFSTTPVQR